MAAELNRVIHDALELSDRERATLVGLLIESLEAAEPDADVEAAWAVEAERPWQEIESGKVKPFPGRKSGLTFSERNDEN